MIAEVAFLFAPGGMNGAEDSPIKVADTEYARATNVELVDELPTTRRGVIIRDFSGSSDISTAAALVSAINHDDYLSTIVLAVPNLNIVNLTAVVNGSDGNLIVLQAYNSAVTASAEFLSGGKGAVNATGSFTLQGVTQAVTVKIGEKTISVPVSNPVSIAQTDENIQGASFFNPAKGQGGIIFAANLSMVLIAIGGHKYAAHFEGRGLGAKFVLEDISNGLFHDPALHQVWWSAWENIAVMQDGQGRAFIWDYPKPARSSNGYLTDSSHKSGSEIPNGATVMAYAHARGMVVLNNRAILVGDQLHKSNLTDSSDLTKFTEQVYNVTSLYFLPPSAMGNITAADILPTRNTVHGHGDVMFHCEDGIFSVDINQAPRANWPNLQLVRCAILKTGATGSYALALFDGDQIFRTRAGVQSLRSAAANDNPEDNPQMDLSVRVRPFIKNDYPRWLRFCSVASWMVRRHLLCTCYPMVQGRYRWARGLVVRNFRPSNNLDAPACWEGLWTLPREASNIVQLVNGIFDGEEKMLALCRSTDGVNRIVEFTDWLPYDVLPDGTPNRISCQLITRGITGKRAVNEKEFTTGTILFKNIRTDLDWGVWFRSEASTAWQFWKAGKITLKAPDSPFGEVSQPAFSIPLGELPKQCKREIRWLQFLIRWKGCATLETIRIKAGEQDSNEDVFDASLFNKTFSEVRATDYDDWEYSTGSDWLDELKSNP